MDGRIAEQADYELLLPLFLGLREFSRERHPPQDDDFEDVLEASRAYLCEVLDRGPECRTILAIHGGRIAGYLVVTFHEPNPLSSSGVLHSGSIDELFINDSFRGLGAGSLLVAAACDWLAAQGPVELRSAPTHGTQPVSRSTSVKALGPGQSRSRSRSDHMAHAWPDHANVSGKGSRFVLTFV